MRFPLRDKTARSSLIQRFLGKTDGSGASPAITHTAAPSAFPLSGKPNGLESHPGYQRMLASKAAAARLGLSNPFFITHQGVAGAVTQINGKEYINFSSYNYLGLAGDAQVNRAAKEAIDRYGTSASASRLVAGERPIQRELEQALAQHYQVQDCLVFVSGHATNVTTIGQLFGPRDLVIHDSLIHKSVLDGIKLSGAARRSFAHNDMAALERILEEVRSSFELVLIVVEGHYSMDGDIPDLPALVRIKQRHACLLMVDEAHSLGVLGTTGKGLHEHFGLRGSEVDIWMGTLSKTLAGCGGYIAGSTALVEHLKYAASGFVYSVGIAPALAAASLTALHLMTTQSERTASLRHNAGLLLETARQAGLDTGSSLGLSIIPIITGSSTKAVRLSNQLHQRAINVQPIIYPAVEEKTARLRLFVSAQHTRQQIFHTIAVIKELLR
ncbi:8-amino-7-oxononanoate synthase [Herbaspirillum rubrisubalbicans]|uniref:aminotransferase class I/II-fold pyridoxal phosphate-dependent enzyme n=1 Tax=Herbaspirillum rubrisubalbicans TaxID=80842 RepID=UPI00209D3859|nr:aminotransferase class I/II-fold pyridoxal phosphate-dependent enzyme [Herbaspirillum rubrisubalbicans]MCP1574703.1 8-amino-7-oxononanoate synthase [Herbaspirillum rubrisubalbicans]